MTVAFHREFSKAAGVRRKPKPAISVTIRLTREERDQLESEAGDRTLSAYARARLFGSKVKRGPDRRPSLDTATLARLLATLGQSDLAANMRSLAQSARSGTLECGPALCAMLERACGDIADMRRELICALGVKAE